MMRRRYYINYFSISAPDQRRACQEKQLQKNAGLLHLIGAAGHVNSTALRRPHDQ